jgi:hypothetical protein
MFPRRPLSTMRSLTAMTVLGLFLYLGMASAARADAGTPGWAQRNDSGFGSASNSAVSSLDLLGGSLYAGTWNEDGAQVWRAPDGRTWSRFDPPWSSRNVSVNDAQLYSGRLYFGTGNEDGAEIWRTDGTTWEQVATVGLDDTGNYGMNAFAVFADMLYVATANLTTGVEIWRSDTGNRDSWQQVNADGFGRGVTWENVTLDVFNGYLYAGISRVVSSVTGRAELWRTEDGTTWTPVFTDGLGSADNSDVSAMAEFKGDLYIGLRNRVTGGQVWRAGDGVNFTPAFVDGLGNTENRGAYGLIVFMDKLYVTFSNFETGAEAWQTADGATWQPVMQDGWGKGGANAWADYFDKAAVVFHDDLYIGTVNDQDGGEIWLMLPYRTWLPQILKP